MSKKKYACGHMPRAKACSKCKLRSTCPGARSIQDSLTKKKKK